MSTTCTTLPSLIVYRLHARSNSICMSYESTRLSSLSLPYLALCPTTCWKEALEMDMERRTSQSRWPSEIKLSNILCQTTTVSKTTSFS